MIAFEDFASLTDVAWRSHFEVEQGIYIAEGTKTIERAICAGHALRTVISEPRWTQSLIAAGVPAERISEQSETAMESITGYHVHRGALAAFDRPAPVPLAATLDGSRRVVVIEDVVDHANIGAIMRSAAAFEIDAVILTPRCADPLYRRAIKVSMGAVFAVPWTRASWDDITAALEARQYVSFALTPAWHALDIREISQELRERPLALVLGTEGDGLTEHAMRTCTHRVRIPMAHGVDSLNVAAAAAVACFELTR